MYRNRAEATSAFQVVPAGEGEISPAEAVEALPRPPQAEAPVQPLPVKVASAPGPVRKRSPSELGGG